jgi:hypothetical protein
MNLAYHPIAGRLALLIAVWGLARAPLLAERAAAAESARVGRKIDDFIPFPVLKDPGNSIADQFGGARTPEVFVLDEDRVVRYCGRIDDQFGIGYQKKEANRNDLQQAVEELLVGKAVSQPTTETIGCLIGTAYFDNSADNPANPDLSKEVTWGEQTWDEMMFGFYSTIRPLGGNLTAGGP